MNNISIALKVFEFNFKHEYIDELLGLAPTDIHIQGEDYFIGPPHNQLKKTYEYNYWEYRIFIENNSVWVKTIIDQFVEEVIFKKEKAIEKIKNDCGMELYVGINFSVKEGLDSFHFDLPILRLLANLNIEIDIDQYLSSK
jgi:hypothetical protein